MYVGKHREGAQSRGGALLGDAPFPGWRRKRVSSLPLKQDVSQNVTLRSRFEGFWHNPVNWPVGGDPNS